MRIVGHLDPSEDRAALEEALRNARELVLRGERSLLLHDDHRPELSAEVRRDKRRQHHERLRRHTLKRWVFRQPTSVGDRIVKIVEPLSVGARLEGLVGASGGRREDRDHRRGEALGVAATYSVGYLEYWSGLRLLRSCQVQLPLADRPTLDVFLASEIERFGLAAMEPLGLAFADMHRRGFFHGDLKGFHAFPWDVQRASGGPAHYSLRWLDLGRVAYRVTRRRRLINLYQIFRFVLPDGDAAQERFVAAYCQGAGWATVRSQRLLRDVRRFLAYKLVSHPQPDI